VAGTTITLEGPNQWTQSGSSFGRPWDQLVAEFKKVTGVTVNTDVLPLATFSGVESAQLAAGIAPDLVFNQATYQPYMVVPLNNYLSQPDPFVAGGKSWLSEFDQSAFSAQVTGVLDAKGNFDWVPFNLAGIAMYYNKSAFRRAGITAPISTFSQLIGDCGALAKAGYTPMAMDNSVIGTYFPYRPILDQLIQKQFSELNHFTVTGAPGTAPELTTKDLVWGIATGKFSASDPYVKESVVLLKQLFESCATKNWSGITGLSGDGVGLPQFESGRAAMTFAVNLGYGTIAASAHFPIGSMPFPEITTATTERELVYRAFTDPGQLAQWFGPAGCSVPRDSIEIDARPGGRLRFVMTAPDVRSPVDATFTDVVENELLAGEMEAAGVPGVAGPLRVHLRLEFHDEGNGETRLELR